MYKKSYFKFVNVSECENLQKIEIGHSTIPAMSKEYAAYTSILSRNRQITYQCILCSLHARFTTRVVKFSTQNQYLLYVAAHTVKNWSGGGGYSQKKWVGVRGPLPKTLLYL